MPAIQPTHRLRMRVMCNGIKATLLSSKHDPFHAQSGAVVTALARRGYRGKKGEPLDERTWLSWWVGARYPNAFHRKALDEVVGSNPSPSSWLEPYFIGSPLQKHLFAIDALGLGNTSNGKWIAQKEAMAWTVLRKIALEWRPESTSSSSTPDVLNAHDLFSPVSVLQFLFVLAHRKAPFEPHLLRLWAIDCLTAFAGVYAYVMCLRHHCSYPDLGENGLALDFASRVFWDNKTNDEVLTALLEINLKLPEAVMFVFALLKARESYQAELQSVGLTVTDIKAVVNLYYGE